MWWLFIVCVSATKNPNGAVILNMIVKNEIDVLGKCLESVDPIIDGWVIVDTGSTDGTQDLIREKLGHLPGVLYERPWVHFEHNRQEALELAREYIAEQTLPNPYILIIDADDHLVLDLEWQHPPLTHDSYRMTIVYGPLNYKRNQLIRAEADWFWRGVVHEVLHSNVHMSTDNAQGFSIVVGSGSNRRKDPDRFAKDALLLEGALVDEPGNTRYQFYLAQSYRDSEQHSKAIEAYRKRVAMGGWEEEVYYSLLQIAVLLEKTEAPDAEVEEAYWKAINFRPQRLESYYNLARRWRLQERYEECRNLAMAGAKYPYPEDVLFVRKFIHDYGLLLEQSVCAYWTQMYSESAEISALLLERELPESIRKLVTNNLHWAQRKIGDTS